MTSIELNEQTFALIRNACESLYDNCPKIERRHCAENNGKEEEIHPIIPHTLFFPTVSPSLFTSERTRVTRMYSAKLAIQSFKKILIIQITQVSRLLGRELDIQPNSCAARDAM